MTLNEYQQEAARTRNGKPNLTIAALGLCGESGEFADHVKKYIAQGHDLDCDFLIKELGDLLWYVAAAADAIGVSLEDVARINQSKLRVRYPDGFTTEASVNRKE